MYALTARAREAQPNQNKSSKTLNNLIKSYKHGNYSKFKAKKYDIIRLLK